MEQALKSVQTVSVQKQETLSPASGSASVDVPERLPDTQSDTLSDTSLSSAAENRATSAVPERFPQLFFEDPPLQAEPSASSVVYLTFDNTPSENFWEILDVLEKHHIKATFFVWRGMLPAQKAEAFYQALEQRGHSIGLHSYSNQQSLDTLYQDVDTFLEDYSQLYDEVFQATQVRTRLYRLPGGSVNPHNPQRQAVMQEIKHELDARGFLQFDWNRSAQDAVFPPAKEDEIVARLLPSSASKTPVVILMHDGTGSRSTVQALEEIIPHYIKLGYTFLPITEATRPLSFLEQEKEVVQ